MRSKWAISSPLTPHIWIQVPLLGIHRSPAAWDHHDRRSLRYSVSLPWLLCRLLWFRSHYLSPQCDPVHNFPMNCTADSKDFKVLLYVYILHMSEIIWNICIHTPYQLSYTNSLRKSDWKTAQASSVSSVHNNKIYLYSKKKKNLSQCTPQRSWRT